MVVAPGIGRLIVLDGRLLDGNVVLARMIGYPDTASALAAEGGATLGTPYEFGFTTGADIDETPPTAETIEISPTCADAPPGSTTTARSNVAASRVLRTDDPVGRVTPR